MVGGSTAELEGTISASKVDSPTIQTWLDQLDYYTGSVHTGNGCNSVEHYYQVGNRLAQLQESLKRQKTFLNTSTVCSMDSARLDHLMAIASFATFLSVEAFNRHGSGEDPSIRGGGKDDETILQIYRQVESAVLADGQIDEDEKKVLFSITRFADLAGLSTAVSPLLFLQQGYSGSAQGVDYRLGNGRTMRLYMNNGEKKMKDVPCQEQAALGYIVLKKTDPRVTNRRTDKECYTFALSDSPKWEPDIPSRNNEYLDENIEIINKNYRIVDLEHDPAKKGDVVVYLKIDPPSDWSEASILSTPQSGQFDQIIPPSLASPHMGVVSRVNRKGRPTHAIGKFGHGSQPIYEHPIDQAILPYGHLYVVVRKK